MGNKATTGPEPATATANATATDEEFVPGQTYRFTIKNENPSGMQYYLRFSHSMIVNDDVQLWFEPRFRVMKDDIAEIREDDNLVNMLIQGKTYHFTYKLNGQDIEEEKTLPFQSYMSTGDMPMELDHRLYLTFLSGEKNTPLFNVGRDEIVKIEEVKEGGRKRRRTKRRKSKQRASKRR
jgi:hypothetical protein